MNNVLIFASLLALALPARARNVCGIVTVLGRPLPEGFARSGESVVRIKDGRFCLARSREPIWVSPLGLWQPMEIRDFSIDGKGPRTLEYVPPPPSDDLVRVRGILEFPPDARALESGPALVMIQTMDGPYSFAWVSGPLENGRASFSLSVAPGKLRNIVAFAEGYGLFSLDPPFHPRYNDSMQLRTAQDFPLRCTMKPSGRLTARVTEDRVPFKPALGSASSPARLFGFYVSNPDNAEEFYAYAGPDGLVEVPRMPAGLWQLQPVLDDGRGGVARAGPELAVWIAAGKETSLDYALGPEARVRVDHKSVALEPYWQQHYAAYPPRARWVVGFPAGSGDPRLGYRFSILEEAAFGVTQRGSGAFRLDDNPQETGEDQWFRAPAGDYDAYLLDNGKKDFPYARVLARRPGLHVAAVERTEVSFSTADFLPTGSAELRGTIKASMRWTFKDIETVRTISDFYVLLGPYVNVYDEAGRLEGTAFNEVNLKNYKLFFDARELGDLEAVRKLFYGRPREFRARDLPPGRHFVEAVVKGYPLKRVPVALDEGKPFKIDIDLDSP